MICHRCTEQMTAVDEEGIQGHLCHNCQSHAITLGKLRKGGVALNLLKPFWLGAKDKPAHGPICPSCKQSMVVVQSEQGIELDVCRTCTLLFFDHKELYALIKGEPLPTKNAETVEAPSHPSPYSADVHMIVAAPRADDEFPERVDYNPQLRSLRHTLAVMGIPVKRDALEQPSKPWITWFLIPVLWGAWIYTCVDKEYLYSHLAFTPEDEFYRCVVFPWFQDGLSELLLVTWAFLNFATDMETFFGRIRFALASLAWMLSSACLLLLLYPAQSISILGMGGMATMVICYFAVRFPTREVGMYYLPRRRYEYFQWKDRRLLSFPALLFYPMVLLSLLFVDLVFLFAYTIFSSTTEQQEALFYKEQLWPHVVGMLIGLGCGWIDRNKQK